MVIGEKVILFCVLSGSIFCRLTFRILIVNLLWFRHGDMTSLWLNESLWMNRYNWRNDNLINNWDLSFVIFSCWEAQTVTFSGGMNRNILGIHKPYKPVLNPHKAMIHLWKVWNVPILHQILGEKVILCWL